MALAKKRSWGKIILLTVLGVMVLLVATAALIPVFFKGHIKTMIDKELSSHVNAKVHFEMDQIDISIFSHFPALTISIDELGVINRAPFEGDTLFTTKRLELEANTMDLIDGNMRLTGIYLDEPKIRIKVLPDGRANYDIGIAASEEDSVATEDTSSAFSLAIDHWKISKGNLVYDDRSLPFKLELNDFEHTGKGDFSLDTFDLITKTEAKAFHVAYDSVKYVSNKKLKADVVLGISNEFSRFAFKEAHVKINDFKVAVDGFFALVGDDFDMDLIYASEDNDLKSFLSLVPKTYLEGFESAETTGMFSFKGIAKGIYNDERIPAINLHLDVTDASYKYEHISKVISEINVKAEVTNEDGILDHTHIDVTKFHVNVMGNPIDASVEVSELHDAKWDLKMKGKLDLAEVSSLVPMNGRTLKGLVNLDAKSRGRLSMIEGAKYDQLVTSGNVSLKQVKFTDPGLTLDLDIKEALGTFDSKEIELKNFETRIGKSDLRMDGLVTNYMGYFLDDKQVLKGNLNVASSLIDLDELQGIMLESEPETKQETSKENEEQTTTSLGVFQIPENIDFVLDSKVDKIKMADLMLENAVGNVGLKDGVVNLSELKVNTLGGQLMVNGAYDTKDTLNPKYDLRLAINKLSIDKSFKAFSIVEAFAPMVENVLGNFNTEIKVSGLLTEHMTPNLKAVDASGLLKITEAKLKKSGLTAGLEEVTDMKVEDGVMVLRDIQLPFRVENGKLHVKRFKLSVAGHETIIMGVSTLEGALDFKMKMVFPIGEVGTKLNMFLGKGNSTDAIVYIKIGGTIKKPKFLLIESDDELDGISGVDNKPLSPEKEKERKRIMAQAQKEADQIRADAKVKAAKEKKDGYAGADELVKEAGEKILAKFLAEEAAKILRDQTDKSAAFIIAQGNKNAEAVIKAAKIKGANL